jgi:hypothetical protein
MWISTQRACTGNEMLCLKVHSKYERLYNKLTTNRTSAVPGARIFIDYLTTGYLYKLQVRYIPKDFLRA